MHDTSSEPEALRIGDLLSPDEPVTLSNCDREPIHIPGAIQPHGILLAIDVRNWTVRQASITAERLGGRPVRELIGRPLVDVIGTEATDVLRARATEMTADASVLISRDGTRHEATVHMSDGMLVCELEPAGDPPLTDQQEPVAQTGTGVSQPVPRGGGADPSSHGL